MKNLLLILTAFFVFNGCSAFHAKYIEMDKNIDCDNYALQNGLKYQTKLLKTEHLRYISHYKPDLVCFAMLDGVRSQKEVCEIQKITENHYKESCYYPYSVYARYYKKP